MRSISLVCLMFLLSSITANADVVSGGQPRTADLSGVHMLLFAGTPANTPFVPKLPDTGQTTSYTATFGEDSDYTINPPSYTDNGDGTVSDNNTGLMWQQEDDDVRYNWYQATGTADATYNPDGVVDVCGSLTTGGYNDWRLPTKKELATLVDYDALGPAIDTTYFPGTNTYYWSSTSSAMWPGNAWARRFDSTAYEVINSLDLKNYARCVRGEPFGAPSFTDNGDGTVTDNNTGLMWLNVGSSHEFWEDALTYCEGLTRAGASDWRLANINELQTLIDDSNDPPVYKTYFPQLRGYHWSSTSWAYNGNSAWYVSFSYGHVSYNPKHDNIYFPAATCVRGGQ